MSKTKKDIVIDYKLTGDCLIDIEETIKQWNEKFVILQWEETYRLVKYRRLGQESTNIKVGIPNEQALELIEKLNLQSTKGIFNSSKSWRK